MKRLLALLFFVSCIISAGDTLTAQTVRLNKVLWANQKQFGLTEGWIDLSVRHRKDMKCGGDCWGDTYTDDAHPGYIIEIMAVEDMPTSIPVKERPHFQNEIVQHEVMHIVLTRLGVASEDQDTIIEGKRALGLRVPMRQH